MRGAPGGPSLDLLLLVDSSGSTATTDPDNLRVSAANYLLDYVQAIGEARGEVYRFAAANFSTGIQDVGKVPWTVLKGDAWRDKLFASSTGGTDFKAALDYALDLRAEPGGAGKLAVVIFTDGRPDPAEPNLDAYFDGLGTQIIELQETDTEILVVALGDNSTEDQWQEKLGAANYRYVDANTDLAGVYHDFLAGLLGLGTEGIRPVSDGTETTITVEPYLEELVISVIKESTNVQVDVANPFGGMPEPSRGGESTLHVVYALKSPTAGTWTVRLSGGGGQVIVDRQYATLDLDAPTEEQALGEPVDVTGRLIRHGIVIDNDPDLHLSVAVKDAAGRFSMEDLIRTSDGRYIGKLTGLSAEGTYTLTLSGEYGSQPVGRNRQHPSPSQFTASPNWVSPRLIVTSSREPRLQSRFRL